MRAGPHRDAGPVDDGRDVVRMRALQLEGHDGALLARMAENAERVDLAQPFMRIAHEAALVAPDARLADRLDIVDGGAEPDRLDDRWRAGLEAMRRLAVGDAILRHLADHLAPAIKGRHGGQMPMLAVEHADAGRSVELVPGDDVEVAVEIADVDVEVNRPLRAV